MAPRELATVEGRRAFGADAVNYNSARPEYPARVFELLHERCGLGLGTRAFEIAQVPALRPVGSSRRAQHVHADLYEPAPLKATLVSRKRSDLATAP